MEYALAGVALAAITAVLIVAAVLGPLKRHETYIEMEETPRIARNKGAGKKLVQNRPRLHERQAAAEATPELTDENIARVLEGWGESFGSESV